MAIDYRSKMVQIAQSKVGTECPKGDDQFIEYYNSITGSKFNVDSTAWCAIFCTWVARQAGVPTATIPNFAGCTNVRDNFFKPNKLWKSPREYRPQPGDLIFFDWDRSGNCDHVGIVVKTDTTKVYTIEGNSKGGYARYGVRAKSYPLDDKYIAGYGAPAFGKASTTTVSTNKDKNDSTNIAKVKEFQVWLNSFGKYGLVIDGSFGRMTRTAAIKAFQKIVNDEFKPNPLLAIDGSFGPATKKAAPTIKKGAKTKLIYIAQGCLYAKGYNPLGFDGSFGIGMHAAVKLFQKAEKTTQNGQLTPITWEKLLS